MTYPSNERRSTAQRLLLLTTALAIATIGWFLLGESETLIAEEGVRENVLAVVNGKPITETEVEQAAAGRLLALARQRHELLAETVESQVHQRLYEDEASRRGMSVEALLQAEVEAKAALVPAAEVDAFYQAQAARAPGRMPPREQVEGRIREHLAFEAFKQSLLAAHQVEYRLEPFRVAVAADGPRKGPANAPVVIVAFSDFECPFCGRVNPTLKQVQETYGERVQIVFRQFPLPIHEHARSAGEASLCADEQGAFWAMHDAMFEDQQNLDAAGLRARAADLGLDVGAFGDCLASGRHGERVARDVADGTRAGVSGTPAFFINGRFLNGAVPLEAFTEIIDQELAG